MVCPHLQVSSKVRWNRFLFAAERRRNSGGVQRPERTMDILTHLLFVKNPQLKTIRGEKK